MTPVSRVAAPLWALALSAVVVATAAAQPEPKDPEPPSVSGGPGVPLGPCGPDAFGYTCDTTVPFAGIDISGTGTVVVTGDDTSSGPIPLDGPGFFEFYGPVYAALVMASNGYISTDPTDTGPDLSNDCPLPAPPSSGGGARLYPLHDDLILSTGRGLYQYFATCPRPPDRGGTEGCHIFMWDDVAHWPGGPPTWDHWVYLYDFSLDFTFEVGPGNPEQGAGSTTGIQNESATIGLTVACDAAGSIPDDFAVTFYSPVVSPTFGHWGLALCAGLLLAIGIWGLPKRRSVS